MAVLDIVQQQNPELHLPNSEVSKQDLKTDKLTAIIQDLVDSMRANNLIAIAAPQLNIHLNIFVTEIRATKNRPAGDTDILRIYINPEIIYYSKTVSTIYEGCGSVATSKNFAPVTRPKSIRVKALDENGAEFILNCDGILARAIQHEFDHLHGKEFSTLVKDTHTYISAEEFRTTILQEDWHITATKISLKQIQVSTSS